MKLPKIQINNYAMYGLNHNRAFMTAPLCECGCGEPALLMLKTKEDVFNFCGSVLSEYDCEMPAIFMVFNDGTYAAAILDDENEEQLYIVTSPDMHLFSELDGELRFCCYNLITEREPGMWMIES